MKSKKQAVGGTPPTIPEQELFTGSALDAVHGIFKFHLEF